MANPFGITEVDVPGALSLYDQTKRARLADMLTARKVQQEDAELERQGRLRDVYSRVQNPAASFPPAGAAAPQASLPSSPAGQPQIPSTWLQANQGLISEMMALDAKEAFQLQQQLSQMDEAQIKRMGEINKTFAATGQWLLQFPENERRARLAEVAPELARIGISQEQIGGADLSDRGIRWLLIQGRDLDKIAEDAFKEKKFEADEAYRKDTLGLRREELGVKQGALGLARQRESRVAAKGGGGDSDYDPDLSYLLGGN